MSTFIVDSQTGERTEIDPAAAGKARAAGFTVVEDAPTPSDTAAVAAKPSSLSQVPEALLGIGGGLAAGALVGSQMGRPAMGAMAREAGHAALEHAGGPLGKLASMAGRILSAHGRAARVPAPEPAPAEATSTRQQKYMEAVKAARADITTPTPAAPAATRMPAEEPAQGPVTAATKARPQLGAGQAEINRRTAARAVQRARSIEAGGKPVAEGSDLEALLRKSADFESAMSEKGVVPGSTFASGRSMRGTMRAAMREDLPGALGLLMMLLHPEDLVAMRKEAHDITTQALAKRYPFLMKHFQEEAAKQDSIY